MNLRLILLATTLAAGGALIGGCESMRSVRESMHDRIAGVPPKVRVFPGDSKQVYAAARLAMGKLGFEQTRGGPAQGELEGVTRIGGGDSLRSSRQREMTVHLVPLDDGTVEVRVLLVDIEEEDFSKVSNPATETQLRESALYDAFFGELSRQLQGVGGK